MEGTDRAAKSELIMSVVGLYLDPVQRYPAEHYCLTIWGWLVSKYAERVRRLLDGLLGLFKERFEANQDFSHYSWAELKAAGLATDDSELHFVSEILSRCNLMRGGSPAAWGRPDKIEDVVELKDATEAIRWVAKEKYEEHLRYERGRKRLEMGLLPWGNDAEEDLSFSAGDGDMEADLDFTTIFISHSSKDRPLAKALVDCLEACLDLPEDAIRCTSVAGYSLAPGDAADEVLRDNLERCRVVIGLLTEESLKSMYVIMELGAAWGLRKTVCGVLADNVDFGRIPGPMSRLQAIKASDEAGVHSLLDAVASSTGHDLKKRVKCVQGVKAFVAATMSIAAKEK